MLQTAQKAVLVKDLVLVVTSTATETTAATTRTLWATVSRKVTRVTVRAVEVIVKETHRLAAVRIVAAMVIEVAMGVAEADTTVADIILMTEEEAKT